MADFLKILESKIDFSPTESGVAERWFRQVERDSLFANAISSSGGGGYVTSVEAGNVSIDLGEGFTLKNPDTGDNTIRFDPDGDAWFGKNIGVPDDTTMFIISNDNLYNGEQFGEGDLLIGSNSSGKGNMWWDASAGKLYFRSGTTTSVEIGDGGIIATWGEIGGWNIGATTIYDDDSNIVLDSASGFIKVGSGENYIFIDGANDLIRSGNYTADVAGWQIRETGDAEFNSIIARGSIHASVFTYNEISATAGKILVARDAAELYEDVIFPAVSSTVTVKIKARDGGARSFYLNEVGRIQAWNGTAVESVWFKITSHDATESTHHEFTVTVRNGGSCTFHKGTAIVNYGATGQGIIELDAVASNTAPRIQILTHLGQPWTTISQRVVIGQMYGAYGTGENNRYGMGFGDYDAHNYMSYNAEGAGEFIIRASDGAITLSSSGLICRTGFDGSRTVKLDSDGDVFFGSNVEVPATTAFAVFANAQTYNSESMGAGDVLFGDNSANKANVLWDKSAGKILFRKQTTVHTYIDTDGALTAGGGNVKINSSGIRLEDAGTSQSYIEWNYLGDNIGRMYGNYGGGGGDGIMWLFSNRAAGDPWGGTGVILASVDSVAGNDVRVWVDGGEELITLSGADVDVPDGDIFTNAYHDYFSSSSKDGWSAFNDTMLWIKKVGKTVTVRFYIRGTSDEGIATFTVPYTSYNGGPSTVTVINVLDGTWKIGAAALPKNSATVECFVGISTTFASSGNKAVYGWFTYEAA